MSPSTRRDTASRASSSSSSSARRRPGRTRLRASWRGTWRSFLLSSREYRQFCHGYLGRFVDHRTLEAPAREGYLATRRAAEGVLGRLDETLWPPGADGASRDESGNDG